MTVWVNPASQPTQLLTSLRELTAEVEACYHETSANVFHFPALPEQERRAVPLALIARVRPGMTKALVLACIRTARTEIRKRYAVPESV